MPEDFYHKDKSEALLTELREEETKIKDEVAQLEQKLSKVHSSLRGDITKLEKKESKLKQINGIVESYLKHRTNELRALKLTEKQIERQLIRVKKKKMS